MNNLFDDMDQPFQTMRRQFDDTLARMREQMMNQFGRLFPTTGFPQGPFAQQTTATEGSLFITPLTEASEDDQNYRLTLELPGIDPKEVQISVTGDRLLIRAERQRQQEQKQRNLHIAERSYGVIQRSFSLPNDVDHGRISADYRHGLLTLTLPKSAQARDQQRRIKITSS